VAVLLSREGRVCSKGYVLRASAQRVEHRSRKFRSVDHEDVHGHHSDAVEGQGRLALHDPICRYMEVCPPGWGGITLHHLLSHTSGIFNVTRVPELEAQRATPQTRRQMMSRFLTKPLAFAPGEQFEYSNSNYYLLGLVIEKVTGQPYEVVLRERILKPLEMHDTGIEHRGAAPPLHASGYRPDRTGRLKYDPPMDESWSFSAGAMYSTVEDMEKFSDALQSEALLPRAALERMWQPVRDVYGYGWQTPHVRASLSTGGWSSTAAPRQVSSRASGTRLMKSSR
jgi:CubicO group peptidase (beta-lactamase class C family)